MKAKSILKNAILTYFGENEKYAGHTINADIELGVNEGSFCDYWICSLTNGIEFEKSTMRGMDYLSNEDGITSKTFDFKFENVDQFKTGLKNKAIVLMIFKYQKRNYALKLSEQLMAETEFIKMIKGDKSSLKKAA